VRADRGGFYDAAFSADGKLLASAGSDGSVRLWDSASGKEVQSFPGDWRVAPNRVAFSRDGSLLAAVYVSYPPFPTPASSTVRVWQVGTRQDLLNLGPVEGRGERMAFSGDGKVLACVSGGRGTVYSWDIPAGTERPVVELPGNLPTTVVGLSRDAKILVDLDPEAGAVTLLNPVTGKTIRSISVPGEYLSPAVFSADNALLAASSRTMFRPTAPAYEEKRTLRVFETATGRELVKLDVKDQGTVLSLAFFPDRKRLVTGMTNTTVLVWDLSPAK
jgi:WD40 repeat protein